MHEYLKHRAGAPRGFFAAEAAGLRWLAEPAVIPVVRVLDAGDDFVRLEELASVSPSPGDAREFGRRLAALHDSGAPGFGWSPSDTAWFGPLDAPFGISTTSRDTFAQFWAEDRLRPLSRHVASTLGSAGHGDVEAAIDAIAAGTFDGVAGDGAERPSRVHGDLWAGNVMWTPTGAVLIDPSAHGGHRLEDLALLALFGAPFLAEIYAGYEQAHPLPETWQEDIPAHNFFALLAHVRIFGGSYASRAVSSARAIVARAGALRG